MSYTWRSILKASWVLKKGCYWTIGNGVDVDIWEDNWIHHQGSTSTWSKKPPQTEKNTVQELMDVHSNSWDDNLINQLFLPIEAQKILQIPIMDKAYNDVLTWPGTLDGNYTVKTGYQAIMEWENNKTRDSPSTSASQDDIWQKVWALNVPPKHSHLLWRILNGALPVKSNLFKKGVRCDPMCPRCYNQVETIHHVFLDCEWSKHVWFSSTLSINQHHNKFNSFFDWFDFFAKHADKLQLEQITATIYGIWYARNQKVFQNKELPPYDVGQKAISQLHEYQQLNILTRTNHRSDPTGTSRHNISRSPSLRGNRKINVDAHLSSDGHWHSGLLLRRLDGSVVGSATRLHQSSESVIFGEAMGLNDAIDMAEKYGESAITFELDCQTLVNAVLRRSNVRKDWGFVVKCCVKFLQANPNSRIAWVKREMNRPAHELAKWAEIEPNMDWTDSYPICINSYIQKDIGSLYPP
jgi:hypothetical protein